METLLGVRLGAELILDADLELGDDVLEGVLARRGGGGGRGGGAAVVAQAALHSRVFS